MKLSGISSYYAQNVNQTVKSNKTKSTTQSFGIKDPENLTARDYINIKNLMQEPPTTREWAFIINVTNRGAKFERVSDGDNNEITIFLPDNKTPFIGYKMKGAKIIEKIEYDNGRPDAITEYRDTGFPKKTIILGEDRKPSVIFTLDESGKVLDTDFVTD